MHFPVIIHSAMANLGCFKLKSVEPALSSPHCSALWSQPASRDKHLCETKEAGSGGWKGQRGKGIGVADGEDGSGGRGGGLQCQMSVWPGRPYGWALSCVCVSVCARPCLCVSMYPSVPFTQPDTEG